MVCFDLAEPKNFDNVTEKWAKLCGATPKILVGCKSDARARLTDMGLDSVIFEE
jgi:hypothetical protein